MRPRLLYLVGFMGTGKSVVGRDVARRLAWDFVDTDERVERELGLRVEEIFATLGEARFREAETVVLGSVSSRPRTVVATGGGMFLSPSRRNLMKRTGTTLWLDAPWERVRERLASGRGRPLWVEENPLAMRAMYERRRAAYALADVRIDASPADPAVVAERVLKRFVPLAR